MKKLPAIIIIIMISVLVVGCGSSKTQTQQPEQTTQQTTSSPQPSQSIGITVKWVGFDDKAASDIRKVFPDTKIPEGQPFGHFKLTYNFAEKVKYKNLSALNHNFDKTASWSLFLTTEIENEKLLEPMAVFNGWMVAYDNGQMMNLPEEIGIYKNSPPVSPVFNPGPHTLDLYLQPTKQCKFDKGQDVEFELKCTKVDGTETDIKTDAIIN